MYVSFSGTPCVITFLFNVGRYDKISVIDIERSLGCRSIPECSNAFFSASFSLSVLSEVNVRDNDNC